MADFRVIKKGDKFISEVKKKMFWHAIKEKDDQGVKIKKQFDSYENAREYLFDKIKVESDKK